MRVMPGSRSEAHRRRRSAATSPDPCAALLHAARHRNSHECITPLRCCLSQGMSHVAREWPSVTLPIERGVVLVGAHDDITAAEIAEVEVRFRIELGGELRDVLHRLPALRARNLLLVL